MSSSSWSRVSLEEASMSFMRDSTLRGASELAERTFLSFSQPAERRKQALGLERTLMLYFASNSLAKWERRA